MASLPLTFAPGPSQIDPNVPALYQEAFAAGIAGISHRSPTFIEAWDRLKQGLREKLSLPAGYEMVVTGSATEAWEVVAQSLTARGGRHYYSGSFGLKWFEYARAIRPASEGVAFLPDQDLTPLLQTLEADTEVLCLTHNETSNGTALSDSVLSAARARVPDALIALDATSSMGGAALPWTLGDIWLASVQKCFGMPAGLGLMALSPRAQERISELANAARRERLPVPYSYHYNSGEQLLAYAAKSQAPYTPNVMAIWVLGQVLAARPAIDHVASILSARRERIYAWSAGLEGVRPLITREASRSLTVCAFVATPHRVAELAKRAKEAGFTLGSGYGPLKASTFRIANFPALTDEDLDRLYALKG